MVHANYQVTKRAFELMPTEKRWYDIADGHFGLLYHPGRRFEEAATVQAAYLREMLMPKAPSWQRTPTASPDSSCAPARCGAPRPLRTPKKCSWRRQRRGHYSRFLRSANLPMTSPLEFRLKNRISILALRCRAGLARSRVGEVPFIRMRHWTPRGVWSAMATIGQYAPSAGRSIACGPPPRRPPRAALIPLLACESARQRRAPPLQIRPAVV